jgi:hypothetical protein
VKASTDHQRAYFAGSPHALYLDGFSLAELAGGYSGSIRTVGNATHIADLDSFIIDAKGSFQATGSGCTFQGQLVRHGNTGVYEVTATVSGCKLQTAMSGLLTPLSHDQGTLELALALDSADNAHTAVLLIEKRY